LLISYFSFSSYQILFFSVDAASAYETMLEELSARNAELGEELGEKKAHLEELEMAAEVAEELEETQAKEIQTLAKEIRQHESQREKVESQKNLLLAQLKKAAEEQRSLKKQLRIFKEEHQESVAKAMIHRTTQEAHDSLLFEKQKLEDQWRELQRQTQEKQLNFCRKEGEMQAKSLRAQHAFQRMQALVPHELFAESGEETILHLETKLLESAVLAGSCLALTSHQSMSTSFASSSTSGASSIMRLDILLTEWPSKQSNWQAETRMS